MNGVSADTVKVLFPSKQYAVRGVGPCVEFTGKSGLSGPTYWAEYRSVDDSALRFVLKGCGRDSWLIWEGSVPKALGLPSCTGTEVQSFVDYLRSRLWSIEFRGEPYFGRVDACVDVFDPERRLLRSARGWSPHRRTKYTEAVYQGGETVMLWNKRRAVRVYDKELESGLSEYRDKVRVEYQMRSSWVRKMGLATITGIWDDLLAESVTPLVDALSDRAGMEGWSVCPS